MLRLRLGRLTAVEVMEAFIARAVEVNRDVNAITEFVEEALPKARELDSLPPEDRGPLHGVPVSLKEHIFIKGHDATVGIACHINRPRPRDADLVAALKRLGAVPFCRTNLPQTCVSSDSSNPIFGVTRNPGDLTRGPGGSSSGEGALIKAGGSVMGFGEQEVVVSQLLLSANPKTGAFRFRSWGKCQDPCRLQRDHFPQADGREAASVRSGFRRRPSGGGGAAQYDRLHGPLCRWDRGRGEGDPRRNVRGQNS